MDELIKRELDSLISEKPASSIPLEKLVISPPIQVDPIPISSTYWSNISHELLDRFNYGLSLGKFGNNNKTTEMLYKRLAQAIIEIIKNECAKENKSSEDLQLHFDAIFSIMIMIGRSVQAKNLTKSSPDTILASMHGFIESYIQQIKG